MDVMIVTMTVQPDRRLVINLPDNVPVGAMLQVAIYQSPEITSTFESAQALLHAAGKLADLGITNDEVEAISDDELEQLGKLSPGARSSGDFLDEDRGVY